MIIIRGFTFLRHCCAAVAVAGLLLVAAPMSGQAQTGASPAVAAAPESPPAINDATELVENPYGLSALWASGDFVARGTLLALVIMSLGSWYIMITKWIEQTQLLRQAQRAAAFWSAGSLREGANRLDPRSAFRMVAEDGMQAAQGYEGGLAKQVDLNSWILIALERSIAAMNNRMQGGHAFLSPGGTT